MDENSFNRALAAAQQLMNDDNFNALVESKANRHAGRKNNVQAPIQQPQQRQVINEFSDFEAQAFGGGSSSSIPTIQIPKAEPRESKVPDIIKESFSKMPALSGNNGLMVPPSSFVAPQAPTYQQPQQITEQKIASIPQTVDYSIIKAIVNECIKENMKSMLNESSTPILTGLRMAGGNKIQFLDSKGNLYEGVLTLKKKAQK